MGKKKIVVLQIYNGVNNTNFFNRSTTVPPTFFVSQDIFFFVNRELSKSLQTFPSGCNPHGVFIFCLYWQNYKTSICKKHCIQLYKLYYLFVNNINCIKLKKTHQFILTIRHWGNDDKNKKRCKTLKDDVREEKEEMRGVRAVSLDVMFLFGV